MVLLVVGNYQAVQFERVPWNIITGITWVHCKHYSEPDLKYKLKIMCREHSVPFHVQFAVPPLETVPSELLRGFGLRLSEEVILYDELSDTFRSATTNQVTEACSNVSRS